MTKCGSCGAETLRLRTLFEKDGKRLPEPLDQCPRCAPEVFERFQVPSEKKMWMSWEKEPAHYRSTEDKDGPIMMPSDSVLQDLQDAVCATPKEELQAGAEAKEKKRHNRRTAPMTPEEMISAVNVARAVAGEIEKFHANQEPLTESIQ